MDITIGFFFFFCVYCLLEHSRVEGGADGGGAGRGGAGLAPAADCFGALSDIFDGWWQFHGWRGRVL